MSSDARSVLGIRTCKPWAAKQCVNLTTVLQGQPLLSIFKTLVYCLLANSVVVENSQAILSSNILFVTFYDGEHSLEALNLSVCLEHFVMMCL